jgi:hypothetical protein
METPRRELAIACSELLLLYYHAIKRVSERFHPLFQQKEKSL